MPGFMVSIDSLNGLASAMGQFTGRATKLPGALEQMYSAYSAASNALVLSATIKAELQNAKTEAAKLNALNEALHYGLERASSATGQELDPQPVTP